MLPPTLTHWRKPEWMTELQLAALLRLYERQPDGAADLPAFLARASYCIGGFVGLQWCGMFVGIEPDGYTHT